MAEDKKPTIIELKKKIDNKDELFIFDDLYTIENLDLLKSIAEKELAKSQATRNTLRIKLRKGKKERKKTKRPIRVAAGLKKRIKYLKSLLSQILKYKKSF